MGGTRGLNGSGKKYNTIHKIKLVYYLKIISSIGYNIHNSFGKSTNAMDTG